MLTNKRCGALVDDEGFRNVRLVVELKLWLCLCNAANLSSEIRAHNCWIVPTAPKAGTRSDKRLLLAYMASDMLLLGR